MGSLASVQPFGTSGTGEGPCFRVELPGYPDCSMDPRPTNGGRMGKRIRLYSGIAFALSALAFAAALAGTASASESLASLEGLTPAIILFE
jgi:hypothetical protein